MKLRAFLSCFTKKIVRFPAFQSAKVLYSHILMPTLRKVVIAKKNPFFRSVSLFQQPHPDISITGFLPASPVPPYTPHLYPDSPLSTAYLAKLQNPPPQKKFAGPTALFTAHQIDISFPSCLHSLHGLLIDEALPSIGIMANPKYLWEFAKIPLRKKTPISEAILLALPWHHNYYHWLIDTLPRLALCQNLPPLLVPASSAPFVKESLQLAGLLDRTLFLEDGVYRVDTLHIPSRLALSSTVSPIAIRWLNESFPSPPPSPPHRKIYISRGDALYHKVTNEKELLPILSDFGFESVSLSSLPLSKKIQLFREARTLIGSHGAGFAHLVFQQPDTDFLEFFQNGHFNPCFANLCAARNIRHSFLVAKSSGLDLSIPPPTLLSLLKKLSS